MPETMTRKTLLAMLGMSASTFSDRLPDMRKAGFPEPDPVLRRYLTADVRAWLAGRCKIKEHGAIEPEREMNHDAL